MQLGGGHKAGHVPVVGRYAAIAALISASASFAGETPASEVRILYLEPLEIAWASPAPGDAAKPGHSSISFVAHGKRFELALEPNHRLTPTSQTPGALQLYRGHLENAAQSWVRLGVRGAVMSGMIWDGRELLVIEPAHSIRESTVSPGIAGSGNVIFRLRDTLVESGSMSCDTSESSGFSKGTSMYASLIGELKRGGREQASGAALRLQLSAIADGLLSQRYSSQAQARDEILLRLNNVDGIYSSEIGVEIQVPTVDVREGAQDPFTATTVASSLLDELGQIRRNSPELRSAGLTHLFTGRNLDGQTVGIAFLDSLCSQQFGAGVTEMRDRTAFLDSLITAHEIGHNFGAVHDGEGACPANPLIG